MVLNKKRMCQTLVLIVIGAIVMLRINLAKSLGKFEVQERIEAI